MTDYLPPDDGDLLLAVFFPKVAREVGFDVPPPPEPARPQGALPWLQRNPWPTAAGAAGLGGVGGFLAADAPAPRKPNTVHPNTSPADDADDVGEGEVKAAFPKLPRLPAGRLRDSITSERPGAGKPIRSGASEPIADEKWAPRAGRTTGDKGDPTGESAPAAKGGGGDEAGSDHSVPGPLERVGPWVTEHPWEAALTGGGLGLGGLAAAVSIRRMLAARGGRNKQADWLADLVGEGGRAVRSWINESSENRMRAENAAGDTLLGIPSAFFLRAPIGAAIGGARAPKGHAAQGMFRGALVGAGTGLGSTVGTVGTDLTTPHDALAPWVGSNIAGGVGGGVAIRKLLGAPSWQRDDETKKNDKETEKKASGEGLVDQGKQLFDTHIGQPVADAVGKAVQSGTGQAVQNQFNRVGEYVKNNPWASNALYYGAPIGAGVGLLGGLVGRKRDKWKAVGDALTGGLLGAGAGAAVGGIQQLWGQPGAATDKPPAPPELKPFNPGSPAAGLTSTPAQNQAVDFARRQYDLSRDTSAGLMGRDPAAAGRLVTAQNAATDAAGGPDQEAAGRAVTDAQRLALGRLPPGLAALTGGAGIGAADATAGATWSRPDEAARALPAVLGGAGGLAAAPVVGQAERQALTRGLTDLEGRARELERGGVNPYGGNPAAGPLGSVLGRNVATALGAGTGGGLLWNKLVNSPDRMVQNLARSISSAPGDATGGGLLGGTRLGRLLSGQPASTTYGEAAAASPLFSQRLTNQYNLLAKPEETMGVEKIREALRTGDKLPVAVGQAAKALETGGGRLSLGQIADSDSAVGRLAAAATKNLPPPTPVAPPAPDPRAALLSQYSPETPAAAAPEPPAAPAPRTGYTPDDVRRMLREGRTDDAVGRAVEDMFKGIKVQNGKIVEVPGTALGRLQAGGGVGAGFTGMSSSPSPLSRVARAGLSPLNMALLAGAVGHASARPSASAPEQAGDAVLRLLERLDPGRGGMAYPVGK